MESFKKYYKKTKKKIEGKKEIKLDDKKTSFFFLTIKSMNIHRTACY